MENGECFYCFTSAVASARSTLKVWTALLVTASTTTIGISVISMSKGDAEADQWLMRYILLCATCQGAVGVELLRVRGRVESGSTQWARFVYLPSANFTC